MEKPKREPRRRPPVLRKDDVSENERLRGAVVRGGPEIMAAVWDE